MSQPLHPLPETDRNPYPPDLQTSQLTRARASVRQALGRYHTYLRSNRPSTVVQGSLAQESLRQGAEQLSTTLNKLEQGIARIAVFGLVSRGKSAVLNALVGRKVLPTGPLNGVTQEPQSVFWIPDGERGGKRDKAGKGESSPSSLSAPASPSLSSSPSLQIELIDTPGLDEIDGQTRAKLAQEVACQSDLILFVVSGDITRTEYQALCELRQAQKPLLLVFNKIDLYPDQTRQAIYQNLQQLAAKSLGSEQLQRLLSTEEIVLVAADPAPVQVRIEHPNGSVTYAWEAPPIQIDSLKQKILAILNQEGKTLLALNALFQARDAEIDFASKILELRQPEAEALIWRFVRYKAIAISLNPVAILDIAGGVLSDLAMIRALAELYGLPITRHEARKLWRTILLSSGGLLLTEFVSGLFLGLGKSAAIATAGMDSSAGVSTYLGTGILQGAIAGYGTYSVGRAIQVYLENGCSWGSQGANTVIQDILNQLDSKTIIYRLRHELSQDLGLPGL